MNLNSLTIKDSDFNIEKYIEFYSKIIDNLQDKSWLGLFNEEKINNILLDKGKIWLWMNNDEIVCSIMYINATTDALDKFLLNDFNVNEVGECGAVLVNEKYRGNGLQVQMLKFLEEYSKKINKKYIITTVHPDNVHSINNFKKCNYKYKNSFDLNRGNRDLYIKEI